MRINKKQTKLVQRKTSPRALNSNVQNEGKGMITRKNSKKSTRKRPVIHIDTYV
jgi:hypothetical protein